MFISEDLKQDGSNWYAYCDSNPIGNVDPTGQWWAKWVVGQNIQ